MRNSHAIREVHQTQEYDKMPKKHLDEVANKGCGDCGQVLGGDIQINREGRGGMHQEIEVFKFLGQMLD